MSNAAGGKKRSGGGGGRGRPSGATGGGRPSGGGGGDSSAADQRSLRAKSGDRRGVYADTFDSDEDEDVLKQTFNVMDKLASPKFPMYFVKEMNGDEVTVETFQRSGFNVPLLIKEKSGLGMTVPDGDSFTVSDVKAAVGARRLVTSSLFYELRSHFHPRWLCLSTGWSR
jgi:hypothetical protein